MLPSARARRASAAVDTRLAVVPVMRAEAKMRDYRIPGVALGIEQPEKIALGRVIRAGGIPRGRTDAAVSLGDELRLAQVLGLAFDETDLYGRIAVSFFGLYLGDRHRQQFNHRHGDSGPVLCEDLGHATFSSH